MVNGNLGILDILIFAGVAAFLIYRLRNVLGKRTGFEKKSIEEEVFSSKKDTNKKEDYQLKDNEARLSDVYDVIPDFDHKIFLDNEYLKFIELYRDLTRDEICVQQFTDDNAIPYLVGKPTCTKYYVNAHIIQNWTEDNFIDELKLFKPNYIVYSSKINWFKEKNNAPNADKFILDNYELFKDMSPWEIYKKKIN